MGVCCSKDMMMFQGFIDDQQGGGGGGGEFGEEEEEEDIRAGDWGARVILKGSTDMTSMFSQQGRKGINQDAMTIWEDFTGEPDRIFCGVFDGHGPAGHIVANHIRDVLPSKLSLKMKSSEHNNEDHNTEANYHRIYDATSNLSSLSQNGNHNPLLSSWANSFINAFDVLDKELGLDPTIDSYCSGSTAVTLLKQDDHLMVSNLGDSRAILCTRNKKNQLVPIQLTVDLKPDLPSEAERIKTCNGRVFSMDEEPNVSRLWLPDEDSPGLAMSRAFGDFCLKDFGLISTPNIYYKKLNIKDEFVVLATDGVWDVLSNKDVVNIISSARKRYMAARLLVRHAVRAWKTKYPNSKVDDCAVICLFLKYQLSSYSTTKGHLDSKDRSWSNRDTLDDILPTIRSIASQETQETTITGESKEEWSALQGVSRVNTVLKLSRFCSDDSQKLRSETMKV